MIKVLSALLTLTGERKLQIGITLRQWRIMVSSLSGMTVADSSVTGSWQRKENIMNKTMDTKTESNTFTKKIGQTTYVVRFHYGENAKETMQEKIIRMLKNEVRMADFSEDSSG